MRKHVATVVLAAAVFGCGGDWFQRKRPGGIELLVTLLEVPDWADWKETIKVKNTVHNYGASDVDSGITVKFYLSEDADYDDTDVELGPERAREIQPTPPNPSLAGDEKNTEDTDIDLPVSGTDGSYYIIAYVDPDDLIDEIEYGEDNNTLAAGPLTILTPPDGVDLVMKYVSGPANAEWAQSIQVDYTVRNRGTQVCTDQFEVSFYLSADEVFGGAAVDPLLGADDTVVFPGATAPEEFSGTADVQIPLTGTDGYYYIIGVANTGASPLFVQEYSDDVPKRTLMENDKASDETIYVANLPNLCVLSVTPNPDSCLWGEQVNVSVWIEETLGNPTPPDTQIQVEIWLSQDEILGDETEDLRLASVKTNALSGMESRELSVNVIANRPPVGTGTAYYLIAKVNPDEAVMEKDPPGEADNTSYAWMSISDPLLDMYEVNNTYTTAYDLGTAYLSTYVYPTISPLGDEDWFKFYVPSSFYWICLTLNPPPGEDYDLYLYRTPPTVNEQSTLAGPGSIESIHQHYGHSTGYYYVRVKGKPGHSSNSTYSLYVNVW